MNKNLLLEAIGNPTAEEVNLANRIWNKLTLVNWGLEVKRNFALALYRTFLQLGIGIDGNGRVYPQMQQILLTEKFQWDKLAACELEAGIDFKDFVLYLAFMSNRPLAEGETEESIPTNINFPVHAHHRRLGVSDMLNEITSRLMISGEIAVRNQEVGWLPNIPLSDGTFEIPPTPVMHGQAEKVHFLANNPSGSCISRKVVEVSVDSMNFSVPEFHFIVHDLRRGVSDVELLTYIEQFGPEVIVASLALIELNKGQTINDTKAEIWKRLKAVYDIAKASYPDMLEHIPTPNRHKESGDPVEWVALKLSEMELPKLYDGLDLNKSWVAPFQKLLKTILTERPFLFYPKQRAIAAKNYGSNPDFEAVQLQKYKNLQFSNLVPAKGKIIMPLLSVADILLQHLHDLGIKPQRGNLIDLLFDPRGSTSFLAPLRDMVVNYFASVIFVGDIDWKRVNSRHDDPEA